MQLKFQSSIASQRTKMFNKSILLVTLLLVLHETLVLSCLITNCPRGGKRSGKFASDNIKPCVSCGPGKSGQCFGPSICCGPFGCLLGTPETIICKREGYFHETEPCIAGSMPCRKNTGRCASDGICCSQESCHVDKLCTVDDKLIRGPSNVLPLEFYGLMNYQNQPEYTSD